MKNTINNVIAWAEGKSLLKKENSYPQFAKVVEEVAEIGTALGSGNEAELIDAIGDTMVTLIILAKQNGLDIEVCLETAYNVIKNRTGKTVNGTFKKDN